MKETHKSCFHTGLKEWGVTPAQEEAPAAGDLALTTTAEGARVPLPHSCPHKMPLQGMVGAGVPDYGRQQLQSKPQMLLEQPSASPCSYAEFDTLPMLATTAAPSPTAVSE